MSADGHADRWHASRWGERPQTPETVAKWKTKDGYWMCRYPGTRKRVHVHRWVLERKIGRPLGPNEHAHHKCEDLECPDGKACLNEQHLEVLTNSAHSILHRSKRKWSRRTARESREKAAASQ